MKYDISYLFDITEKLFKEAEKCYKNKCYIASFVLYGAILEAFLLSLCFVYPEKVRKSKEYRKSRKKNRKRKGLFFEFNLSQLIKIAEELEWLPMNDMVEDIGIFKNWIKWVQETRNLIHPARWMKSDLYFGDLHKLMRNHTYKEYRRFVAISKETILTVRDLLLFTAEKDLLNKLNLKSRQRATKKSSNKTKP